MSPSSWRAGTLPSPTGATLQLYERVPAASESKRPRAVVHILHGMAEHAGRYARFADALQAADYAAIAHDHRGHGRTTAPDAAQGHFGRDGWPAVIADVEAVNRSIRERWGKTPVVVFGHSMGAVIALAYALEHSGTVEGAAVWNVETDYGALERTFAALLRAERFLKGSDVPSLLAERLTFEQWNREFKPNRTAFDWLSRDEAEVDLYVADPLCGSPVTVGTWLAVLQGVRFTGSKRALTGLPRDKAMHLLGGRADPCSKHAGAVERLARRLDAIGALDVTLDVLPDARHESLNELDRDATTARFVAWLDGRFGPEGAALRTTARAAGSRA